MGTVLQANETPKRVSLEQRDQNRVHRAELHARQPGAHEDPLTKMRA